MTDTGPLTGAPGGPGPADVLACLARGIYDYLLEVDGYRTVCRRHEGTAVVLARGDVIHVSRFFDSDSAVARLETALGRLPHRAVRAGNEAPSPDPSCLVRREVVWENRRVLVRARRLPAARLVEVELAAPPWDCDLPELPLRRLADVLRCHEFLIPDVLVPPAPPPAGGGRFLGVRQYLKRAMPPNLYASQCI